MRKNSSPPPSFDRKRSIISELRKPRAQLASVFGSSDSHSGLKSSATPWYLRRHSGNKSTTSRARQKPRYPSRGETFYLAEIVPCAKTTRRFVTTSVSRTPTFSRVFFSHLARNSQLLCLFTESAVFRNFRGIVKYQ